MRKEEIICETVTNAKKSLIIETVIPIKLLEAKLFARLASIINPKSKTKENGIIQRRST